MSAALRTVHVRIAGRVQGVGYRAWTESAALELGLAGWVRNRRDGTVEAMFRGSPEAVAEMLDRCWQGPPAASVSRIEAADADADADEAGFRGFQCLPTA